MSTAISWADETWNPTTGCTKISPGCEHCYAETMSLRFGWSKQPWLTNHEDENVVLHPNRMEMPRKWKRPSRVFVDSMSDLFHEKIPWSFVDKVFRIMVECPQHTFMILTKRAMRAYQYEPLHPIEGRWWPDNIWLGTSVETPNQLNRLDWIRNSAAGKKFISFEPLIARMGTIDLHKIDWVIVGGESGPGFRHMPHEWAREIRDQCLEAGVAFFFKQSAAWRTEMGTALHETDGRRMLWHQYPDDLSDPVDVTATTQYFKGSGMPWLADQPSLERI